MQWITFTDDSHLFGGSNRGGVDLADHLRLGDDLGDDLGAEERYKPLLADYITEPELLALLSQPLRQPPKIAVVDAIYIRVGRAILDAVRTGRLKLPRKAGDEDWTNSFGNVLNDWRKWASAERYPMASELDLWRHRALGMADLLRSRGVTVNVSGAELEGLVGSWGEAARW